MAASSSQELIDAQAVIYNHVLNYINSMSLRCAVQLGIPDIIHKHGKPMTLSQLANAIPIDKQKSHALHRLMRVLVHSKIFDISDTQDDGEVYSLTAVSRLLLRDEPISYAVFTLSTVHPIVIDPFLNLAKWFQDQHPSPFVTNHGMHLWEFLGQHEKENQLFNDALAGDARFMVNMILERCSHVFEGLKTMVDVGGGTGSVSKAVANVFPDLQCTVLDLPHVVAGLDSSERVKFVGGDMLEFIPPADAVFLKSILHDWDDEGCVKILRKCKEAIDPNSGKVIILDMVVGGEKQDHEATETQICFDMMMLVLVTGKERSEKELSDLFFAAGFKSYKISPILGLRSIIEVFP